MLGSDFSEGKFIIPHLTSLSGFFVCLFFGGVGWVGLAAGVSYS